MAAINYEALITNVASGECIPRDFDVEVHYANPSPDAGSVSLACDAANPIADQSAPAGSEADRTFLARHPADGKGHQLTTALRTSGQWRAGHTLEGVEVSNNCPVTVDETANHEGSLPALDPAKPLSGMYHANAGNGVKLEVEDVKVVNGHLQRRTTFSGTAEVMEAKGKGTWKHPAIKKAKAGQHLRVILTQDGEVQAIIRAIFVAPMQAMANMA